MMYVLDKRRSNCSAAFIVYGDDFNFVRMCNWILFLISKRKF